MQTVPSQNVVFIRNYCIYTVLGRSSCRVSRMYRYPRFLLKTNTVEQVYLLDRVILCLDIITVLRVRRHVQVRYSVSNCQGGRAACLPTKQHPRT